jgi:DNA-binding transcriptional ArsR family regulator
MKKSPSTLSSLLIIGFFGFCLLNASTQMSIANKIENLLSLSQGTLSKHLKSDGGGNNNDTHSTKVRSQEVIDYYNEIVMNSEFDGRRSEAFRWTTDMKIYVEGEPTSELLSELERIVGELNDIINPIDLVIVNNRSEANMFVYFGSANGFSSQHPNVNKSRLEHNWGYFTVESGRGMMYVDTYRANNEEQKHLLREELTQSLGLPNDSHKYPESIFYQEWATTTEFAPIDKELIDMLYNN